MKRNIGLLILLTFALSAVYAQSSGTSIECGELPQKPSVAVSDFANVIDDATESQLENDLRQYLATTSISIVVVTTQSIGQEDAFEYALALHNCWGVGDKADRGVLMFLCMDTRDVRISVGYGLEGILTDAQAGRVLDYQVVPQFREGDFSGGISQGAHELMKIMGAMSIEERTLLNAKKAEKEEALKSEKKEKVSNVLLSIFFVLCVVGIFYLIFNFFNARKLRRELNKIVRDLLDAFESESKKADKVQVFSSTLPDWAKNDIENNETEYHQVIDGLKKSIETLDLRKGHVTILAESVHALTSRFKNAVQKRLLSNATINADVEMYAREHRSFHESAKSTLIERQKYFSGLVEAGFTSFTELSVTHSLLEGKIAFSEEDFANPNMYREIYLETNDAMLLSDGLQKSAQEQHLMYQEVQDGLVGMDESCATAYILKDSFDGKIVEMRSKYADSVWGDLSKEASVLFEKVAPLPSSKTIEEIVRLNSMAVQNFTKAHELFTELKKAAYRVSTELMEEVSSIFKQQDTAQASAGSLMKEAKQLCGQASTYTSHSDVDSTTENKVANALETCKSVMATYTYSLQDWVRYTVKLKAAIDALESAIEEAKRDISKAEAKRAAALREIVRKQTTRTTTTTRIGGGFGGFGGGRAGGGGAGRKW